MSPAQQTLRLELVELIQEGRLIMIGPIRQELLSGIRDEAVFERLREHLQPFEDAPLFREDYEEAARFNNRCRAAGVAGSAVDFLICAVAARRALAIFTTDADFGRYASIMPLQLHHIRP
jgi:hypothetical protein